MSIDTAETRKLLRECNLPKLFNTLGWDHLNAAFTITVDRNPYVLTGVAEKRGVQVFQCSPGPDGEIPDRDVRAKLDTQLRKSAHEHMIVFSDSSAPPNEQVWQWVDIEPGKPRTIRDQPFRANQTGERLLQKLDGIRFELSEEEELTLAGHVIPRLREAFGRRDRVTRRFYDRFQQEHTAFLGFIEGITGQADREWYASVMLNRLMFIYFVQKKGFLDGDRDYLKNRLVAVRKRFGAGEFYGFYREFLRRLFHEGLAAPLPRSPELLALIGDVPYLNGGIFDVHQLEAENAELRIKDEAFEKVFAFFDAYEWHLDDRPLGTDNEINPDVLGYIFEKYINQKQMGAYYTKEDITGYISKNTVLPFLLDVTRDACKVAFEPAGAVWSLLREDPDRYIYEAVRKGVDVPLPPEIEAGIHDVAKRTGWNRPAPAEHALPTETWREHIARRTRCHDLRRKLSAGEVTEVNDLITLNLDIRQFAQDVVERSEGPDVVRAFYQAIGQVTILDPTCGSGAFLFAALHILQPLYQACLDRMQAWLDDEERLGRPHPGHRFRQVLDQVAKHPNREYFILKSVIINNLYGVDIMEEAVEICKLRLFLKLVAQVDDKNRLEPLPDIDFNIRAGNTLVGFTSLDAVREAMSVDARGNRRLLFLEEEAEIVDIEESAGLVEQAYSRFREQQTTFGGAVTPADKSDLRDRLAQLDSRLDRYLARQYGVDPANAAAFTAWKASHQPFHWFVEFHGVIARGGFDVVIGNPPYVELREVRGYAAQGFECITCGNLYALVIERCFTLGAKHGRQGYIVPVSSVSTDRYAALQQLLSSKVLHYSSYDDRPSRLFDGLEHIRLTIHLIGASSGQPKAFSTKYNKWNAVERQTLFDTLSYQTVIGSRVGGTLPKLTSPYEESVLSKLSDPPLATSFAKSGSCTVFYSRKVGYFLQVLNFVPSVLDGNGNRRLPSEFKELRFSEASTGDAALCALNSSLFFWFIHVFSDCRHVNKREIEAFPLSPKLLASSQLSSLGDALMIDLDATSVHQTMRFGHDTLTVQQILPKHSKPIIDEIDRALARHYSFTAEELDFIINYDIKYRMGASDGPGE